MRVGGALSLSRLLIATVVVLRGCVTAADVRDTGRRCARHGLRPRLLNGHFVAWPGSAGVDGSARAAVAGRSDGDGPRTDSRPPPPPPPHVHYEPDNVVFTRVQMAGDRAFVVSPRYKPGVPFTLGYVPLTDRASSDGCGGGFHAVSPYPSLRAHRQCSESAGQPVRRDPAGRLVNVVDARLGPDGVLWALDVGAVDTLSRRTSAHRGPTKYDDPRVLGIDVATGDTVHEITLRELLSPVRGTRDAEERTATLARRLRTVVVEYEYAGDDEGWANGSDRGARSESVGPRTEAQNRKVGDHGDDGVHGTGDHGRKGGPRRTVARPMAVYAGDASTEGRAGSIAVWLVAEGRGIRVTLPPSTSVSPAAPATATVDRDEGDDDDDDLDADGLHMALLDGPGRAGRHLYFTYGRHPDVFRIPVAVFRSRRRRTADRTVLRLTDCRRDNGGDGNRCVTNVGRKPTGRGRRPLVPVDSAHGFLWYFRDGASATVRGPDVLYAWDSRRPFLWENFRPVGSASSSSGFRDGCSNAGLLKPDEEKEGGKRHGDFGEKEHDDTEGKRHDGFGGKEHKGTEDNGHDDYGGKRHDDTEGKRPDDYDRKRHDVIEGKRHDDFGGKEHEDTGGKRPDDYGRKKHDDDHGGKGHEDHGADDDDDYDDSYDDEADETCESCGATNGTEGTRERPRRLRSPSSTGRLRVTSVDHDCWAAGAVGDVFRGALWALHTNVRDWLRGRTGRFGATALLCPVSATFPCNDSDRS